MSTPPKVIVIVPPDCSGLIIDAGGYIGTTALKLASAFPQAKVVTIEPSSGNLEVLRRNVHGVENIEVMQAVVSSGEGYAELMNIGTQEWGFSLLNAPGKTGAVVDRVKKVTIEQLAGAGEIALLKMDIEGAEAEVLATSSTWMGLTKVLVAELHEWLVPGVIATFNSATSGRANRALAGEKVVSVRH